MKEVAENNTIEMDETYHFSKQVLDEIKKDERSWESFCKDNDNFRAVTAFEDYTIFLTDADIKVVVNALDKETDVRLVGGMTHSMCHVYERGKMANPEYRKAGDAILDKMIEKAEQGYASNASRSIEGYWMSVKDNPEAWEGLKSVLEKHPNYAVGQKYLGYMNGEEPKDEITAKNEWIEDPNMLFVKTNLVDIDGTLIQDGKLNYKVLSQTDLFYEIYTGGEPESQREKLLQVAVETFLKDYSLETKLSTEKIVQAYKSDVDRKILLGAIFTSIDPQVIINDRDTVINKIVEWSGFVEKLADRKIPIYPKDAFTQDNVCLIGVVIDDTQPEAQGIKSLLPASLNPDEEDMQKLSNQFKTKIPKERQITADEVVKMYNMSQQISHKLQELKSKTESGNIEDIPHAKTQILRELAKDNVSSKKGVVNPKRSNDAKKVIIAAVNNAISKTRK